MDQAEIERKRIIIRKQQASLRDQPPFLCGGCGEDFNLHLQYRCFYCGIYFCRHCAPGHFGPAGRVDAEGLEVASS